MGYPLPIPELCSLLEVLRDVLWTLLWVDFDRGRRAASGASASVSVGAGGLAASPQREATLTQISRLYGARARARRPYLSHVLSNRSCGHSANLALWGISPAPLIRCPFNLPRCAGQLHRRNARRRFVAPEAFYVTDLDRGEQITDRLTDEALEEGSRMASLLQAAPALVPFHLRARVFQARKRLRLCVLRPPSALLSPPGGTHPTRIFCISLRLSVTTVGCFVIPKRPPNRTPAPAPPLLIPGLLSLAGPLSGGSRSLRSALAADDRVPHARGVWPRRPPRPPLRGRTGEDRRHERLGAQGADPHRLHKRVRCWRGGRGRRGTLQGLSGAFRRAPLLQCAFINARHRSHSLSHSPPPVRLPPTTSQDDLIRKAFASGAEASGRRLFRETDQHELYPDPLSGEGSADHLAHFRFLGTILGKAMYEGILAELPFAGFFLGKLRGRPSELNDLATLDPAIYRRAAAAVPPLLLLSRGERRRHQLLADAPTGRAAPLAYPLLAHVTTVLFVARVSPLPRQVPFVPEEVYG